MKKSFLPDNNPETENELVFKEMLKRLRPDLFVLFDLLDQTQINPLIIWKLVRQLANMSLGTGYGTITIEIQRGVVTFVRGEEDDKLQEPLKIKK